MLGSFARGPLGIARSRAQAGRAASFVQSRLPASRRARRAIGVVAQPLAASRLALGASHRAVFPTSDRVTSHLTNSQYRYMLASRYAEFSARAREARRAACGF